MSLKVIKIRDIPREQAKKEIREYLKDQGRAWMDEIADNLKLDFPLLEKEGFVAEV